MNREQRIVNNKKSKVLLLLFVAGFLFWSCDYGQIGNADRTDTYYPTDEIFIERMEFLSGVWYSYYAGTGRLDGYRIRKWSDFTNTDKARVETLFPNMNVDNPTTWSDKLNPQDNDYYVFLYDDTVYGQEDDDSDGQGSWGFSYMGLVRAINIFNDDLKRGAIIIEYFEGADPGWLSDIDGYAYQGLAPGEKPFFGIYFKVIDQDTIQLANAVDLAALYAGKNYYTEKATLKEAIAANSVENEAEFISWGVVDPQSREK